MCRLLLLFSLTTCYIWSGLHSWSWLLCPRRSPFDEVDLRRGYYFLFGSRGKRTQHKELLRSYSLLLSLPPFLALAPRIIIFLSPRTDVTWLLPRSSRAVVIMREHSPQSLIRVDECHRSRRRRHHHLFLVVDLTRLSFFLLLLSSFHIMTRFWWDIARIVKIRMCERYFVDCVFLWEERNPIIC